MLDKANDSITRAAASNPQGAVDALGQCQDTAICIGTYLETFGEEYTAIVSVLEEYCEIIYQMSVDVSEENQFRKHTKRVTKLLTKLKNTVTYKMPDDRKEVVFLPYKASMWDSLESVWKAADADENTDAYVIPIPYYDRNPEGSFRKLHYEGGEYPEYVPVVWYENYDFEKRMPDVIFIHNPYDEYNIVTSVHPFFYSENLKRFTEKLVYIPYFILGEIDPEDKNALKDIEKFILVRAIEYADQVVVQSENMRQAYINVLTEHMEGYSRGYWEKKIFGLGSPKVDKVLNTRKEELEIPEEWMRVIRKPDGYWKKIIFYNTTVTALLQHNEQYLVKMRDVLHIFHENQDEVALLWRPHPLFASTIEAMRPELREEYREIVERYREDGWGIYDDSSDMDRAVEISDAYYGDGSSVVQLYQKTGKAIMLQNPEV